MVRTNIELDQNLVDEAAKLTGIKVKRMLVHEALRALVESKRRRPLSELRGKIRFAAGYDHMVTRARTLLAGGRG